MLNREEQNEAIAKYIFEIDFMTTTEFCKRFGYPLPIFQMGKTPTELATEIMLIDCYKYNKIKDFAKQIRKDNNKD